MMISLMERLVERTSFDAGPETGSTLMSVFHANKGSGKESLEAIFKGIIDKIADALVLASPHLSCRLRSRPKQTDWGVVVDQPI
jgi:hypothetical protein